ncbi:hypothetical protein PR003_g7865 [Phytophthora rubi]|uniref:RING-type domain-containing protein n=1 Tax=Phytophthora rubi TaxID=129364 RepID=A0A6A3MW52_9STRA|nr:hypothetical protein PR002_g7605 [Phytophthora rubi]KAE9039889.1 hypothetical protein PR001_g7319 [Phytophthora rubi]KAE9345616.1 hypothetical protein PR003_g7865 [Phytophthora rubi]
MAAADDHVVDVTMERDDGQEEEEQEEEDHAVVLVEQQEEADAEHEEKEKDEDEDEEEEKEEQDVVEVDGDEEQEQQQQQDEESEDEDVQFVCSVEGTNGLQGAEKEEKEEEEEEEEADVVVLDNGESPSGERSRANMNALMAANGFVTPATLEAELQCIICQYAMFKPVSAVCGHSFCRVCLMNSFLTRSIEEAQCPICRVEILQPFAAKKSLASMFPINVTLWNLVQLLIPSVAERISSYQREEEEDFTRKLDQLDAKWKTFNLSEQAARYHGDHDEEDAGRWEEDHEGHDEYPVLKVEDSQDGNLHVSRNIVLDTNDENEDGYVNMRVGISIVEFPSVFELYNEHQECSVNVIKMEEDEEMADGMPFFMNENGDDDGFVCSSYYNEITLRVCDEGGNCVMERTRGARGGVVTFPGLRLDVPGGVYTFRFSDDLYGLKLSITTRLREPHEISDTPVADYISLINDEAGDASRRNRRRHHDSDNEDDYDEGNESDDSFIVDDINVEAHNEEPVGRFSDDEEDQWEYLSDDEAADEEREQRRLRQQRRSGRQAERDVQFVEEHQEEEDLSEGEQETEDVDEHEEDDDHEEEQVQLGRRNVRVVEEATFSSDAEGEQEEHDDVQIAEEESKEEEHHESHDVARSRRRNANHILDSEDEDEGAPREEQKEDDVSDGGEGQHDENDEEHEEGDGECGAAIDEGDDEDDRAIGRNPSRKVSRAQWFQEDESEEEEKPSKSDVASSHEREGDGPERPRKRARGRDRQVRIIDEGESDEEQEEMERSIVTANSMQGHDEEDNDEDESQFRRVHQFYEEEEVDERHNYEDAQQDQDEEDVPDYPDEEEDQYQEEDYYSE